MSDALTLTLDHGEASALSYFVAFAALHHENERLTEHEQRMITKVSQLDPDAYLTWRKAVQQAAGEKVPQ